MGALQILIAVVIAVIIWRIGIAVIRMLATPPPEVDPEDLVDFPIDYRCTVCGTELTVTRHHATEPALPKHCREEMVPVYRP